MGAKLKKLLQISLACILLTPFVFAEFIPQAFHLHQDQNYWVVITHADYPNDGLAVTREANDSENNPRLDIVCSPKDNKGKGFRLALTGTSAFNPENELWIDAKLTVDENSPLRLAWHKFSDDKSVFASSSRLILEEMINGKIMKLEYRDAKEGLKKYVYGLKNLRPAIKRLEEVCKYSYNGK